MQDPLELLRALHDLRGSAESCLASVSRCLLESGVHLGDDTTAWGQFLGSEGSQTGVYGTSTAIKTLSAIHEPATVPAAVSAGQWLVNQYRDENSEKRQLGHFDLVLKVAHVADALLALDEDWAADVIHATTDWLVAAQDERTGGWPFEFVSDRPRTEPKLLPTAHSVLVLSNLEGANERRATALGRGWIEQYLRALPGSEFNEVLVCFAVSTLMASGSSPGDSTVQYWIGRVKDQFDRAGVWEAHWTEYYEIAGRSRYFSLYRRGYILLALMMSGISQMLNAQVVPQLSHVLSELREHGACSSEDRLHTMALRPVVPLVLRLRDELDSRFDQLEMGARVVRLEGEVESLRDTLESEIKTALESFRTYFVLSQVEKVLTSGVSFARRWWVLLAVVAVATAAGLIWRTWESWTASLAASLVAALILFWVQRSQPEDT